MTQQRIDINKFGVNLDQLVAILDCQQPEASGYHVMAMSVDDSKPLSLKAIRIEPESETVWIQVEEY